MSVRLGRFMELSGVLQPPSLLIGKVWVPVMPFYACPMRCKVHWRVGRRLGSCRLISVKPLIGSTIRAFSIGSALLVLEVLCCLYNILAQHIMVDGCRSKLVNVVSGAPKGSVLGQLLSLLYTSVLFSILENKVIGDADDSTLIALVHPQALELQ